MLATPLPAGIFDSRNRLADALMLPPAEVVALGVQPWPERSAILGIGISGPENPDDDWSFHVYVADAATAERVPREFEDYAVGVEIVGEFTAAAMGPGAVPLIYPTPRWPVGGGLSIGHQQRTALTGTLGCRVDDPGGVFILSCNHVLANCNQGQQGDTILQPGPADGGGSAPGDALATLYQAHPLDFSGATNHVDAALASVDPSRHGDLSAAIEQIGPLNGSQDLTQLPSHGWREQVRKTGRTTGCTQGGIVTVGTLVWVTYPGVGRALFDDQFVVHRRAAQFPTPGLFADAGDSGAVVVDTSNRAVGLLCAVDSQTGNTVVNPIAYVLNQLGVTL